MTALPDKYFLVAGFAEGATELNAFDNALMKAGIGNVNLIRVTSILPPAAQHVPAIRLPLGALVPTAYADETSAVPGTQISAAVACGVPDDPALPGVIMEHHMIGTEQECRDRVVRKLEEALAQRNYRLTDVKIAAASGVVKKVGSAVAAVILWA
ncbi:arginine decarboxylase, pyruvoyl-dependent [bacterium]|nr:arginine decarboxylase, pyruvoyl-dependent [bacterium]MBU1985275.1 arginine decarboxylase, pyruvoyl-dependent [bacterium]